MYNYFVIPYLYTSMLGGWQFTPTGARGRPLTYKHRSAILMAAMEIDADALLVQAATDGSFDQYVPSSAASFLLRATINTHTPVGAVSRGRFSCRE